MEEVLIYRDLENKKLTLSVHYRNVAKNKVGFISKLFYDTIAPWKNKIKVTSGKKVFEIRPPVKWNKGNSVNWLIKKLGSKKYFPIYIGDDTTDEDAFNA